MVLEGAFNIGDVDTRDSTTIIDSTANIQRDNILDSTHTPRGWIQTRTTGCLQYRSPGTNSIDDMQDDLRRIASDVSSSRTTISGLINILADDQHSSRGPTRLFKQPRVARTNTLIYTCWVLYIISLYFLMVIMISE